MARRLSRGIRQIGSSYFVDVTYKGRRLTATTHSLNEAVIRRGELLSVLTSGKAGRDVGSKTGKVWTLGEALDRTTAIAWSRIKAGPTMIRTAQAAVKFFGRSRPLDTIVTESLDQFVFELEKAGNSNSTINRKLSALSKMMTIAIERGGLDKKPPIPHRKEYRGRLRFITREEEKRLVYLFRQWGDLMIADGVIVLIDTGIRIGELLRLREADADLKQNLLHVWQSKTEHPRTIPMTMRVASIINSRRQTGRPGSRIFPTNYYHFRRAWDRARSHMGLMDDPQFVIHALRHTCASRLVQRGVSLRVVQEWMGHKSFIVTLKYAHLTPSHLYEAARVLEAPE